MTTKEVAQYLGYSLVYVRELTRARRIPFYKIGGRLLFKPEDIQNFLEQARVEAIPQSF